MELLYNWKLILKHAWSVRLMLLAALVDGINAAWPYFENFIPVTQPIFGSIGGLLTIAAIVARFVAQKPISGDNDGNL